MRSEAAFFNAGLLRQLIADVEQIPHCQARPNFPAGFYEPMKNSFN